MRRLPFDDASGSFLVDGELRRLQPQEQTALHCLLRSVVASRDDLMTALYGVWADPPESAANVVRVVVFNLRRKLAPLAVIYTIKGLGYRLDVPANDNRPQPQPKGAA